VGIIVLCVGCNKQSGGNVDDAIGIGGPPLTPAQTSAQQGEAVAIRPSAVNASSSQIDRVIESCNVEQVNGRPFGSETAKVSKTQPVTISGWVVDKEAGSAEIDAELRLISMADAATYAVPLVPALREDVARTFGLDPVTAKPGFNVTFDAEGLVAGDYKLLVVIQTAGKAASCYNGRVITIA
jgi:hypothetical protein